MTSISTPATGGYEELAPFYDAFTRASDYENWITQVLALLTAYGWRGSSVFDVACGTGNSFLPLLRRGYAVTACDRSPAMLAVAARKAPEVPLIEADMRDLPSTGRFELVTCFDDSLNHLLDEGDLSSAFVLDGGEPHPAGALGVRPQHVARVPDHLRDRQRGRNTTT